MDITLYSQFFWVALTIISFKVGKIASVRFRSHIFSPILIGAILLITTIVLTRTSVFQYEKSVHLLNFFLTPITIVLAIPIYKQLDVLKRNFLPIIVGSFVGSLSSIILVYFSCKWFKLDDVILKSLITKSVTAPIAIPIVEQLGGLIPITMLSITVAGLTGATILPTILKIFMINDNIAQGIAMGTASHAVGTSRAVEINQTVGAMSSLAIGITGIITAIIISAIS